MGLKKLFDDYDEQVFEVKEKKSKERIISELYFNAKMQDIIRVISKKKKKDSYYDVCINIISFYKKNGFVSPKQKMFLVRFIVYHNIEKYL